MKCSQGKGTAITEVTRCRGGKLDQGREIARRSAIAWTISSSERAALGVNDQARTQCALSGIVGTRLTYRARDHGRRSRKSQGPYLGP
jgi:hypothetical protein